MTSTAGWFGSVKPPPLANLRVPHPLSICVRNGSITFRFPTLPGSVYQSKLVSTEWPLTDTPMDQLLRQALWLLVPSSPGGRQR